MPAGRLRVVAQAVVGIGVGLAFLWLAFRHVSWSEVRSVYASLDPRWLLGAVAAYGLAVAMRIIRWRCLLQNLQPDIRYARVAETLVLGYAVNNVLPARLGEVYRAHYAKRRFGLSRSSVLGSIVVERMLDGLAVVCFLALGLALLAASSSGLEGEERSILGQALTAGLVVFGALSAFAWVLRHPRLAALSLPLPEALARRVRDFRDGLTTLQGGTIWAASSLSLLIWTVEGFTLWCVLRSLQAALDPVQILILTGIASLSTLIPTAPAYLGTLQYAFVLALGICGLDESLGLVAATVTQLFIFGGLTLAGCLVYLARRLKDSLRGRAVLRPTEPVRSTSPV